jgi:uncharacterized protein YmfQ (DUF2313 family)
MLCFTGANTAQRVHQVKLTNAPSSNADFFRRLAGYYYQHRERGRT